MANLPDFQPFEGEPSLLKFTATGKAPGIALTALPPVLLGLMLTVAAIKEPSIPNGLGYVCTDLRTYVGLKPVANGKCATNPLPYFPLSRDILSLSAAIILGFTPILIRRQWSGFSRLISHMHSRGALTFTTPDDGAVLREQIELANRDILRISKIAPLTMLATSVTFLVLFSEQARNGAFYALAPQGTEAHQWALSCYKTWWANPSFNLIGALTYFIFGAWGLYVITQQNFVGSRIMWALWRSRRTMNFGADPINMDGYYGWRPLRDIVGATYTEIAIHGTALIFVGATLEPDVLFGPLLLGTLQWLLTLPFYILFPPLFARKKIAGYKDAEIEKLDEQVKQIDPATPLHEQIAIQQAVAARMDTVRRIPTLPFKSAKDLTLLTIGFFANLLAIFPVLIALLTHS